MFPIKIMSNIKTGCNASVYHYTAACTRVYSQSILYLVLKNNVDMKVGENKKEYRPGDFLFVNSGTPIEIWAEDAYVLVIGISDSAFEGNRNEIRLDSGDEGFEHDNKAYIQLLNIVKDLIEAQEKNEVFSSAYIVSKWHMLIYTLQAGFCSGKNTDRLQENRFREVPDYFSKILFFIDENYTEPLKLKDLSDRFYISNSNLSKQFVKYTGVTFLDYLNELRLTKAMPLIMNTDMEISNISDAVGFGNPRSFQQAFQKKYNTRPSRFRREYSSMICETEEMDFRKNIESVRKMGLFDILDVCRPPEEKENEIISRLIKDTVRVSLGEGEETEIARANNVLKVSAARDFLIDEIRQHLIKLKNSFDYDYITCHSFLSDDLLVIFYDVINNDFSEKNRQERRKRYDFAIYNSIFSFIKELQIPMIINLSYMPMSLAEISENNLGSNSTCFSMPASMEEYREFIVEFVSYIKKCLGSWIYKCKFEFWPVPDVHIKIHNTMTEKDFFELYRTTYMAVMEVLPGISFTSPSFSKSLDGLNFMARFIKFCIRADCLPSELNFTHYAQYSRQYVYSEEMLTCENFVSQVKKRLTENHIKLPINCSDYADSFGLAYYKDSILSALFPVKFTLGNSKYFKDMGYCFASDYTTDCVKSDSPYQGGFGLLDIQGHKKPSFYALDFLSKMGNRCIYNQDGCCITTKENSIQILLYYEIPSADYSKYRAEDIEGFFGKYPQMRFSASIAGVRERISGEHLLVKETYINWKRGSAYDKWIMTNQELLYQGGFVAETEDSRPEVQVSIRENREDVFEYSADMEPAELRLVEIMGY